MENNEQGLEALLKTGEDAVKGETPISPEAMIAIVAVLGGPYLDSKK